MEECGRTEVGAGRAMRVSGRQEEARDELERGWRRLGFRRQSFWRVKWKLLAASQPGREKKISFGPFHFLSVLFPSYLSSGKTGVSDKSSINKNKNILR